MEQKIDGSEDIPTGENLIFSIAGEGLCAGRDSGEPVTGDYPGEHPHAFTGGTIKQVAVDVSGDAYIDLEREAQAMLARE